MWMVKVITSHVSYTQFHLPAKQQLTSRFTLKYDFISSHKRLSINQVVQCFYDFLTESCQMSRDFTILILTKIYQQSTIAFPLIWWKRENARHIVVEKWILFLEWEEQNKSKLIIICAFVHRVDWSWRDENFPFLLRSLKSDIKLLIIGYFYIFSYMRKLRTFYFTLKVFFRKKNNIRKLLCHVHEWWIN